MLTVEEKIFLDHYKRVSYHRFYEIERFVTLSEKLNERPPKADKNPFRKSVYWTSTKK